MQRLDKLLPQTHALTNLVSAILVAITIFRTPGGGLLKTWEELERKIEQDICDIERELK